MTRSDQGLIRRRRESFHGAASVLDHSNGRLRYTLAPDFKSWLIWTREDENDPWRSHPDEWPTLAHARVIGEREADSGS